MYFTHFMPILSPFNQQMETHASDEISKERQRRSQQGGGGGGGDVDGLEGGMAGVSLREGEGGDAEANNAEGNNGEEKGDDGGDNEDDVDDDDDEDCDYVPENYHDENSKFSHPLKLYTLTS